jgi:hypothetical protein
MVRLCEVVLMAGSGRTTEWSALAAFPVALTVLLVVVLVYFLQQPKRNKPLQYLESAWSFKESWASNVTVAVGLVAGIFGSSEVVTTLVGENGKSSVALATVAAAVAAAFVAAGPLILLSSKTKDDFLTVGGLLAASAVTLAGGFGEIWVLFRAGERLDLGGWQDAAVVMAGLATLLLAWYAIRSIPAVIRTGQEEPPTPPPSDTLMAAKMIVEAIKAAQGVDTAHVDTALEAASALHPELKEGARFDSPHKRRTALL